MIGKRTLLFVLLISFTWSSCTTMSQKDEEQQTSTIVQDSINESLNVEDYRDTVIIEIDTFAIRMHQKADILKMLSTSYKENAEAYAEVFLKTFPSTFAEFNYLYGYGQSTDFGPLYTDAEDHLAILQDLDQYVDLTDYVIKLVNIAKDGHWYADAVNIFQKLVRNKADKHLDIFIQQLKQMSDLEIKGFWIFFFDERYPETKLSDYLNKIQSIDFRVYEIMKEIHYKTIRETSPY